MCKRTQSESPAPIPACLATPKAQERKLSARSVFGIRHQIPDSSEPARVPACQGNPTRKGDARLPPLASGHAGNRLIRSSRPGDRSVSRARRLYRVLDPLSRALFEDRESSFQRRASAPHGRLAAVRRGRSLASPESHDYRTSTSLCQVRGSRRFRVEMLRARERRLSNRESLASASYYVKYSFRFSPGLSRPGCSGL